MAITGTILKTLDIRDIREEVKYPDDGLTSIFELQKELIGPYIKIEGLPQYPIDVNTKSSQVLLKDFSARIVEELGEAWESFEIMMKLKNTSDSRELMISHLQNYNEEVADAIHFWAEMMIYIGAETQRIRYWMSNFLKTDLWGDMLLNMMYIGKDQLMLDYRFMKRIPAFWVIRDEDLQDEFLRGGRMLGKEHYQLQKELLWDITYHLQIARNTLKNKPWKQTEMMTDENLFENEMMKATISLFKFFSFAGFNKISLYTIYYKKNRVNKFRQESKY